MSILITNLSKTYRNNHQNKLILDSISLAVEPGETVALMGPNGAGKTTLLRILATLVLPDAGTASVAGWDLVSHSARVRASIGLVYDAERSFYQMLSVEQNLSFFARLMGIPRRVYADRLGRLGEEFSLSPWLGTVLAHCSSGIRQRAAFVRALLSDPQILLVDEPTRSVDAQTRERICRFLRESGKTCLMVTHDEQEARAVAKRTLHLNNGCLERT